MTVKEFKKWEKEKGKCKRSKIPKENRRVEPPPKKKLQRMQKKIKEEEERIKAKGNNRVGRANTKLFPTFLLLAMIMNR